MSKKMNEAGFEGMFDMLVNAKCELEMIKNKKPNYTKKECKHIEEFYNEKRNEFEEDHTKLEDEFKNVWNELKIEAIKYYRKQ